MIRPRTDSVANANFLMINHSGHMISLEQPALLADVINHSLPDFDHLEETRCVSPARI